MTCIAAVVDGDNVYMGGDSAGVSDDSTYSLGIGSEAKVWGNGGLLFGASGSFRVSQVLRWQLQVPQYNPDGEALEYLTGPLITTMRESLQLHGALSIFEEDSTENIDGALLIGFRGRVFEVFSDFGVGELVHGYGSVGCGSPIAMGALAATELTDIKPKRRIIMALEAAERHSAGVRGPFTVLKS